MKTVGLLPRRPDSSRAAFRDHYENRHAPLALGYFPFTKYVRNHVVASDPDPVGFDCLSEFWVDDLDEVHRLMTSEAGDIMRADELRFADQPKIATAVAKETHVAGSPRTFDEGVTRKEALLLRRGREITEPEFAEIVARWGRQLAAGAEGRLSRLTLDALTPFDGRDFPLCDAILYGWTLGDGGALFDAAPPNGVKIYGRLGLEAIETRL